MTSNRTPVRVKITDVVPIQKIGEYVTDGHWHGKLVGIYDTSYGRYGQVDNGDNIEYQIELRELVPYKVENDE